MGHLQVKNFPDDLYETLRERAKAQRTSVSALVTDLLRHGLERLTVDDWLASLQPRPKTKGGPIDMEKLMDEVRGRPPERHGRSARSA